MKYGTYEYDLVMTSPLGKRGDNLKMTTFHKASTRMLAMFTGAESIILGSYSITGKRSLLSRRRAIVQ